MKKAYLSVHQMTLCFHVCQREMESHESGSGFFQDRPNNTLSGNSPRSLKHSFYIYPKTPVGITAKHDYPSCSCRPGLLHFFFCFLIHLATLEPYGGHFLPIYLMFNTPGRFLSSLPFVYCPKLNLPCWFL